MELVIQQRDLLKGIARTHAVADRKNSMAILSNVLLTTHGAESLRLSTSDLYVGVSAIAKADVRAPFEIAVGAKTLFDIVRALPEGEVLLSVDAHHALTVQRGKIRYKIPGFPGADFPPLPNVVDGEFTTLAPDALSELIGLTSYSMLSDDTRPHLAGTLFEGEGESIRMVTTDGHRLSFAEASATLGDRHFKMLIPHKGVAELKRLVDDTRAEKSEGGIELCHASGHVFFRCPDVELSVRLAEDQFLPYTKVIPQHSARRMVAPRQALIQSLKRISLVSADKSGGVELQFETGVLRIASHGAEGEGREELEVDYDGDTISVGFNARYFLDALGALSYDEVALEFGGELDAGVIKPIGEGIQFIGVIMPMKL